MSACKHSTGPARRRAEAVQSKKATRHPYAPRRRNNLTSAGILVVTVSKRQVYSMTAFDEVARQIARHLGARPRGERARGNLWERRRRLRDELLAPRRDDLAS